MINDVIGDSQPWQKISRLVKQRATFVDKSLHTSYEAVQMLLIYIDVFH